MSSEQYWNEIESMPAIHFPVIFNILRCGASKNSPHQEARLHNFLILNYVAEDKILVSTSDSNELTH